MAGFASRALVALSIVFFSATALANACIEDLSVRPKSGKIQLIWTHVGQSVDYEIERRSNAGGAFQNIATTQSTFSTFLDISVDADVLYYYQIRRVPGPNADAFCLSDEVAAVAAAGRQRMARVPDIGGQTEAAAESSLAAARLSVGEVGIVTGTGAAPGTVIAQDPPPNSSVPQGFAVSFDLLTPLSSDQKTVRPEGGIFEFPNGVILDIPAGAVSQTAVIEITNLSCDQVDVILSAPELATHTKRCLRGFSAKPDGLTFDVPIVAIVPVILESNEIPVQIGVDLNEQTYRLVETGLVYRDIDRVVEMTLEGFSNKWLAALLEHIDETCKRCSTYVDDLCGFFSAPDPAHDPLQPGACRLLDEERESCASGITCCREELMRVEVTDVEFGVGECQIVGGQVNVSFPTCEGSPTESYSASETSGCPDDMAFEIEIGADRDRIYVCEQANLKAELSGTNNEGKILLTAAAFPADWSILSGNAVIVGDIPPNGKVVEGRGVGNATIRASAVGKGDLKDDFTLRVEELELEIAPAEDFNLSIGDSKDLRTLCVDCPQAVTWTTDNRGVVGLAELPDGAVSVTAIGPGTANVFARSVDHCGEEISDLLTVTVPVPGFTVTWSGTISGSAAWSQASPTATAYFSNAVAALWEGSAALDYQQNVYSASTSGYSNDNYTSFTEYSNCPRSLNYVEESTFTITDAGANSIKNSLSIIEIQGSIVDPVGALLMGGGWTTLDAGLTISRDTYGYTGCDQNNELIDARTVDEHDTQFPFSICPGNLHPDDGTGLSFSKQCQGIVGYLGSDSVPVYVTWQVSVQKIP